VEAAQPVRRPGPASLLNEPLDMEFPNSFGPGIGDRVASMSDSLGSRAFPRAVGDGRALEEEVDVGEARGHWSES